MCIDCRSPYSGTFSDRRNYDMRRPDIEMFYQISKDMMREMQFQIKSMSITPFKSEKTMSIGTMMKKLLDKDTQTLVKAGFINGDLELTDAGKKALWAIIFTDNKAALVIEAQEVLDEAKK